VTHSHGQVLTSSPLYSPCQWSIPRVWKYSNNLVRQILWGANARPSGTSIASALVATIWSVSHQRESRRRARRINPSHCGTSQAN
jgi:hypothetical protein